jgi:hypothetical protein
MYYLLKYLATNMCETKEFLYQSITDTQATIKAIDVKLGFLFVLAFTPLTLLSAISPGINYLWNFDLLFRVLIVINFISWFLSLIYLFFSLTSISNPNNHISGPRPPGLFYGKNLFKTESSNLFSTIKITCNHTVDNILSTLPSGNKIIEELIYEKIKITYIREIKISYYVRSTKLIFIWLCLGLALYITGTIMK